MRGNETQRIAKLVAAMKFLIPMRGNEHQGIYLPSLHSESFLIPMRGNEDDPVKDREHADSEFLIPMRGNEEIERWFALLEAKLVPDPHEG